METLIVKVEGQENISFLITLLHKFDFVTVVKDKIEYNSLNSISNKIPIQWAKSKPSISDFAGIWEDRDITISKLREKAWKRS